MKPSAFTRALAFVVALAFTGQVAAPALDGLVYHSGTASEPGAPTHWDPAGGCQSHGERCELGLVRVGPRAIAPPVAALLCGAPPVARLALRAARELPSTRAVQLHHSRAPPVLEG